MSSPKERTETTSMSLTRVSQPIPRSFIGIIVQLIHSLANTLTHSLTHLLTLIFLLKGSFAVLVDGKQVSTLSETSTKSFGELALMHNAKRAATVRSLCT